MFTVVASAVLVVVGAGMAGQGTDATPCEHLKLMTRLARIAGSADAAVISKQADLTCSANVPVERWPNNQRVRSVAGRWQYPSGATAKTPPGHWYYPDGTTSARSITNDWYYPDGKTMARNRQGGWRRPDGPAARVEELLKWSCDRVDAALCKELTADYGRTTGDEKALALIELAWAAHTQPATRR